MSTDQADYGELDEEDTMVSDSDCKPSTSCTRIEPTKKTQQESSHTDTDMNTTNTNATIKPNEQNLDSKQPTELNKASNTPSSPTKVTTTKASIKNSPPQSPSPKKQLTCNQINVCNPNCYAITIIHCFYPCTHYKQLTQTIYIIYSIFIQKNDANSHNNHSSTSQSTANTDIIMKDKVGSLYIFHEYSI